MLELNKVLRVGGVIQVVTHPAWPPHELPWDFWRFPKGAFTALFNLCDRGVRGRAAGPHVLVGHRPADPEKLVTAR